MSGGLEVINFKKGSYYDMTDKERIIAFLQKLIPDNFVCGHISLTFNDDGSLLFVVNNKEE